MTTETATAPETHAFEADVSKLLRMMVHSVYSDRDVFLRELISSAADACEKLRYEGIATPSLSGEDPHPRIRVILDADQNRLTIEDNGIGMTAAEMGETLGTIARSGTKAFMERLAAEAGKEGSQLIGQFGVGFYSSFIVADKVEVLTRQSGEAAIAWISDGVGDFSVAEANHVGFDRGTKITLKLKADSREFCKESEIEKLIGKFSQFISYPIRLNGQ